MGTQGGQDPQSRSRGPAGILNPDEAETRPPPRDESSSSAAGDGRGFAAKTVGFRLSAPTVPGARALPQVEQMKQRPAPIEVIRFPRRGSAVRSSAMILAA
jgi:hypothetical protein